MKKMIAIKITILIVFFGLSIITYSCSCSNASMNDQNKIPASVVKSSDNYIISKTGKEFFNKYISQDFDKSLSIPPDYFMVYKLFIPEKPFVDSEIRFTVDSLGNVAKQKEIVGIPDCTTDPANCNFIVDEKSARDIASEAGLEKGIKDWKTQFYWDSNYNKYVWKVLSTLNEKEGEFGYRGSGIELLIDPNSGKILSKNEWKVN